MPSTTFPDQGVIQVTVHLHSILRHRGDRIVNRLDLELPPGSQASDVLRLLDVHNNLEPILALNGQVVTEDTALSDGDHLAIIPAVAGG